MAASAGRISRISQLQQELLHVENLLSMRSSSVEELTSKVRSLSLELKTSSKRANFEYSRASALENRIEEIAQLLQIVTNDRDSVREDCARHIETINIQTKEREDLLLRHDHELKIRSESVEHLHNVISEEKDRSACLDRQNMEQRAAAIDLVNTVSSQAIELEKLREQLLAERKRAENAEAKCTAILNVLTE